MDQEIVSALSEPTQTVCVKLNIIFQSYHQPYDRQGNKAQSKSNGKIH